jgi:hypothetical protein
MAYEIRKLTDAFAWGVVQALNLKIRADAIALYSYPHADVTSTSGGNYQAPTTTPVVVAATAVDLPSTITAAEQARTALYKHFMDGQSAANFWGGAHKAADTVNAALISYATIALVSSTTGTLAQVIVLLTALKAASNAHVSQSGVHFTNDSTNSVTASAAVDLGTSETLATGTGGLKAFVAAHVQFAGAARTIKPVAA